MTIRRLRQAAAAIAMAVAVTSAAHGQEAATVRVGIANAITDAPFFIADKKGYFKDEGLDVTLLAFNSAADMIAPLGAGQLDVGSGSPAAGLYNAVARGIDVRVVADKGSDPPGYGFQPLLVRADLIKSGRFKTIKDLKGLTFASNTPGSTFDTLLNAVMKKAGLKYTDVKLIPLGFPEQVVALTNGSVDASFTPEPNATEAVKSGAAVRVMGNDVIYPNEQISVIIYGGNFIKNHRDLGLRFMRAYLRAVRYYNDAIVNARLRGPTSDDVVKILTESTKIKDPAVFREIVANGNNPNGHVNVASMRDDFNFFKEEGLIHGQVKPEDIVDPSFAAEAVRTLGLYRPLKK